MKLQWDMQLTRMRITDNNDNDSIELYTVIYNNRNNSKQYTGVPANRSCQVLTSFGAQMQGKHSFGKAGPFLQVSEGLDFADSNARAVLIFGIPFPNVKDTKVGLKKAYNDAGQRTHRLLSGDQWYTQQAFRCVRRSVPALCLCTPLCLSVCLTACVANCLTAVCLSDRLSVWESVCGCICKKASDRVSSALTYTDKLPSRRWQLHSFRHRL